MVDLQLILNFKILTVFIQFDIQLNVKFLISEAEVTAIAQRPTTC